MVFTVKKRNPGKPIAVNRRPTCFEKLLGLEPGTPEHVEWLRRYEDRKRNHKKKPLDLKGLYTRIG